MLLSPSQAFVRSPFVKTPSITLRIHLCPQDFDGDNNLPLSLSYVLFIERFSCALFEIEKW